MSSISQEVSVYSRALDLRTMRHQVLASNIANADTPSYKARDFSFEAAMRNAKGGLKAAGAIDLDRTSPAHIKGGVAGGVQLQYRTDTQSAVDGNTVDMDVERTQITDNAVQYQVLTQLISQKFAGFKTALTPTNG